MPDRSDLLRAFLAEHGWGDAAITPVAGDASMRAYFRALDGGRRAIVMDADPTRGEDVRPFVRIARFLSGISLSAPEIYAADEAQGILLLEDLGDGLFARLLARGVADENRLYTAATDVLLHLHAAHPPALDPYDAPRLAELATLAVTWYRRGVLGAMPEGLEAEFAAALRTAFAPTYDGPRVLVQRDYHAENLLWLPERRGVAQVGLLDFQDAMSGHPAYDLVSVLQDARRDVPEAIETEMLDRYITAEGVDAVEFRTAYALLGLQRNLRIVGVFARLWLRDGKQGYLSLIPRVWAHVETNLARLESPALTQLVHDALPVPDAAALDTLRAAR